MLNDASNWLAFLLGLVTGLVVLTLYYRKKESPSQAKDIKNDEIVMNFVLHTAALALQKNQYVEFAPIQGTCGTIKLSGNSLPCFEYTVFDKKLMEFIRVRVEISKPDRIQFFSRIQPTQKASAIGQPIPTAPKADSPLVEMKDQYQAPFWKLAEYLVNYFPYPMNAGVRTDEHQAKPPEFNSSLQASRGGTL